MWEIIPNPGIIKIYTSGCPKNQNKCWYRTGFPPPAGSKNLVLKFRSVSSIVIAPASTGNLVINSTDVTMNAHNIKGNLPNLKFLLSRAQIIVDKKFTAPMIEEIPAKCREKIARSTLTPEWNVEVERGGYTVQPLPTPVSTIADISSKEKDGINNQNLRLFIRGNAISVTPNISGINQLPNPPIEIGITAKKIITKAWAVTTTL